MEARRNDSFLLISFLLVAALPAYRCIMYIFQVLNISLPLRMFHIYLVLMAYMIVLLIKYNIHINGIIALVSIWIFYGISYVCGAPESRVFYNTTEVSAILVSFAPISCLCTSRVENWDNYFISKRVLIITDTIIVASLIYKLNSNISVDYMSYSYGLLPLWGICLISALYYSHRIQWIFFAVGFFEGLIFGARAPLIWVLLLIALTWIIQTREDINRRSIRYVIPGILLLIIAIIFMQTLLPRILKASISNTSYVLQRIQDNSLYDGAGREYLYSLCRDIIRSMGLNINGLFYDRTVLPKGFYSHNFIYEILISLGWVLGLILIFGILLLIGTTFFKQSSKGKVLTAYFCCSMFFRYLFSGSIFDETGFIFFLSVMFSLQGNRSATLRGKLPMQYNIGIN